MSLQVQPDSGTLASYVPRALLARISLATAREARADYEVAATIDVLDSLGVARDDMLRDRDEIVERLKIERLPVPVLAAP